MLLINLRIVILQGTGSQVTPGFPHSQIRLRVASPKVQEHGRTTPVAYELASDTYHGLGVVTKGQRTVISDDNSIHPLLVEDGALGEEVRRIP